MPALRTPRVPTRLADPQAPAPEPATLVLYVATTAALRPVTPPGRGLHRASDTADVTLWDGAAWRAIGTSYPTATDAGQVPLSTGAGTTYAAASLGEGGLASALPSAAAAYVGRTYYATDTDRVQVCITDGAGHYGWVDITPRSYALTHTALPGSADEGEQLFVTDGRKVGEGSGSGTGVPVYWSNGAWRVYSTDAAVTA